MREPDAAPTRRYDERKPFGRALWLAGASLAAVSLAAYLLERHPAHTLAYAPYLLLALCPLMHFLHHGRRH